jgi:NaMN:DMB phosphoribosyltransferase
MHDLDQAQLNTVVGGARKTDDITQQITALQTSLKDAISATTNKGGDNTFMLLAVMMAMRPQQATVVTGGGAPVVTAAAPSSIVSIRNRVRV